MRPQRPGALRAVQTNSRPATPKITSVLPVPLDIRRLLA